ncbi:MAG TPA: SurA N-terminal domain-containing protein [Stellaceae bacterium]|jgi:peptidyl-prolyl cis-trans isomerase D
MLQAIRSKAGSWFVKALFGLLIVTFGIWGIGDIFRNRTPDTVVATVGGQTIDAEALQTAVQPALERLSTQTGSAVDLQQAKKMGVIDEVLRQLIDRSLIDQETARLKIEVSDDVIRNAIMLDPMFRGENGAFDRAAFDGLLAANHLTEGQYVARLRQQIPRNDLLLAVTDGAVAPPSIVDRLYRYRDEKRIAEIVALPDAAAGNVGQPSLAQLTKFYDAHQDLFRAPEYRGFTLASLTPSELARTIKVPDARLKSAYEQRQAEFVLPERRDVQQILTSSAAKAKTAEAALAAGKSWNEVATTIAGQDPGTIDLGLVKREDLPETLAKVAFALPLDKPSAPLQSPLGWHILRVVRIEPPKTQSLDEAKAKLQAEIAHDEAVDRLYTVANHVDDAIAGGADIDAAAAKFGLTKTVVAAVDEKGRDRSGHPVTLPVSPATVLKLAFATDADRTTRVTQTSDGAIFVLDLTHIAPPSVRPLAEVKAQAIAGWQADQRREAAAHEAHALAAAVKPGASLATLAAARGLKATTSEPFLRQSTGGEGVPPALVGKLFAVKPGAVVTAADAGASYVAQLTAVQEPPTVAKAATAGLSRQLDAGLQADLGEELTQALRRRFPVSIQHDTLDRLF